MKNFGIVINEQKNPAQEVAERIRSYLEDRGARCILAKSAGEITAAVESMLILGGDGTMLQAARETAGKNIPLLGVNLGTLGYLAEVEVQNLEEALDKLLKDEFETEERMMLSGRMQGRKGTVSISPALNDISITRCGPLQIIQLKISVDGQFLCEWKADGVIVATPTGSTGYSMSAGGPLIEPGAGMIVLTPICPHTLNARSIVLRAQDRIEIEVSSGRGGARLMVEANADGSEHIPMETGDKLYIGTAEDTTTIVKLNKVSFLEMLHKKIYDEQ